MGSRQAQGLLIGPLSAERGWPLAVFSLAVALHNLFWGAFQPVAGALADRWGAARVAASGALAFGIGMIMVASGGTWATTIGLGIVAGYGLAATSYSVILGPVGRAVAPADRIVAMGTGSALGSLGMMMLIPLAQGAIAWWGASGTVWLFAVLSLLTIPLSWLLHKGELASGHHATAMRHEPGVGFRQVLRQAWEQRGYRLLTLGFFVCGFQIAFIGVHLPGYLALCGMSQGAGATALLIIGGFNVLGTLIVARLPYPPQYTLAVIYLSRAAATALFVLGPKTEATLLAFAAVMGLLWLTTVPPTTGVIARLLGVRHIGMLYGVAFFSHQIGAFIGAWLGGVIYDRTLTYDAMWIVTVALGCIAAAMHVPIRTDGPREQAA